MKRSKHSSIERRLDRPGDIEVHSAIVLLTTMGANEKFLHLTISRPNEPDNLAIPGGKIEKGETAAEAAARELLEETGLRVDSANLEAAFDRIDDVDGWVCRCFRTRLVHVEGEPRAVEAGTVVAWRHADALLTPACTFGRYNEALFTYLGFR